MTNQARWFVAAAAVALAAGPAAADNQWGSYHWARSANPLALTVERQINEAKWLRYYDEAVDDWEQSTVLSLTKATGNFGVSPRKCDPLSGKVLVCSDSYGFRGWLGIARIWATGDHISQATTQVNDSYFNLSTYDTPPWHRLVMCQEIGHDFGLDHQDEIFDNPNLGTCQDYTNDPDGEPGGFYGPSNEHPNQHDLDTLQAIYEHLDDGGGSGGGGGCNPRSPKCAGQDAFTFREVGKPPATGSAASSGDWGRAIAFDGAGRPDTFLLDLGNGRKKITHVFWVPGFKPQAQHFGDSH